MKSPESFFVHALLNDPPLLWDGGMGTMLIARGMKTGEVPELWNIERPDQIRDIHKEYFDAGARAGQSNTFGGHPIKLRMNGLENRVHDLNKEGVLRVREVAPVECFAIGDIGPSGAMLPPVGDADEAEVRDGFRVQALALKDGGADALHIETMFDLTEMLLAVEAASETKLPVIASMTFQNSKRGMFTMMGVSPQKAMDALNDAGVVAVGANCSVGPKEMVPLVAELKRYTNLPIIAQPNAGEPRVEDDKTVYDMKPAEFASYAVPLVRTGASIIGGCCGTTPAFIREMAKELAKL